MRWGLSSDSSGVSRGSWAFPGGAGALSVPLEITALLSKPVRGAVRKHGGPLTEDPTQEDGEGRGGAAVPAGIGLKGVLALLRSGEVSRPA